MSKFIRLTGSLLGLLCFSLSLAACGTDVTGDIKPFDGAKPYSVDQKTQDSFKAVISGIKDAKLTAYTITGAAADIKTYYDNAFRQAGWVTREAEIADIAKQQSNQQGWALAYEKGTSVVSLTLTPGTAAQVNFPNINTADNLLLMISATK